MTLLQKSTPAILLLALAGAPAALAADGVKFGDAASEQAHRVRADDATAQDGALGEPCRRIRPDGALAFDLSCDPEKQNYLTVKFWGSDGETATIFLCSGDKRIGKYGDEWPELDLGMGGPAFPGRFYYTTYHLPKEMTAGRSKVRVKLVAVGALSPYESDPAKREKPLEGPTRGIYRAYSDVDPLFRPGTDEAQGKEPAAKTRPRSDVAADLKGLRRRLDDTIDGMGKWQLHGPAWEAAVAAGKVPAVVLGAVAPGARPDQERTADGWKDFAVAPTSEGNAVDLNILAVFAQAYQSPWSRHYHDADLLDRVVRGLDFYAAAQGDNGSFFNKTWVGGSHRKAAAGSALEGFGTQGLGRAFALVRRELEGKKRLEETINGDGGPAVRRRDAWAAMFARHRDYLATPAGRGHAANQDMAQVAAMWLANEAVRALAPDDAWPRDKALRYVRSAVGLENDPLGGYWVTRKGLALEPWGTLGGGYCGNYGLNCVHEMATLAELTGDEAVRRRAVEAVHAAAHFYYPAVDEDGRACMKKEGIISTRNTKWPCVTGYDWDYYTAGALKDPDAVRSFQVELDQVGLPAAPSGAHQVDELKDLMYGQENLEKALALPPTDARLPMEVEAPDFAWADEQGGTVAVKHGADRLYVSLNWRRGFKDGKRDPEHVRLNNVARIHFTQPTVDRIATIAMDSPQGFGRLYVCRYGDYFIAMNLTDDATLETPAPADAKTAVDLISGKAVDLKAVLRVPPSSTFVLYLGG